MNDLGIIYEAAGRPIKTIPSVKEVFPGIRIYETDANIDYGNWNKAYDYFASLHRSTQKVKAAHPEIPNETLARRVETLLALNATRFDKESANDFIKQLRLSSDKIPFAESLYIFLDQSGGHERIPPLSRQAISWLTRKIISEKWDPAKVVSVAAQELIESGVNPNDVFMLFTYELSLKKIEGESSVHFTFGLLPNRQKTKVMDVHFHLVGDSSDSSSALRKMTADFTEKRHDLHLMQRANGEHIRGVSWLLGKKRTRLLTSLGILDQPGVKVWSDLYVDDLIFGRTLLPRGLRNLTTLEQLTSTAINNIRLSDGAVSRWLSEGLPPPIGAIFIPNKVFFAPLIASEMNVPQRQVDLEAKPA